MLSGVSGAPLIGIIGAPNKGKSTLFSALTMSPAKIADYPFTTIKPNLGVAYATRQCAEKALGVKCNARNNLCINGTRMIPVTVVDVAGLVEGAHSGEGMGNQFLNDLSAADAFMLVVDATGRTDAKGMPSSGSRPAEDVKMVMNELSQWLYEIIKRHMPTISKSPKAADAIQATLSSMKIRGSDIEYAIEKCHLTSGKVGWLDSDILAFSKALLEKAKPIAIVANKIDMASAKRNAEELRRELPNNTVFECSAVIELALREAASQKIIDYVPGSREVRILSDHVSNDQRKAIARIQDFLGRQEHGTGVQDALNSIVFDVLGDIVVYPVEDENKYTNHFGEVLPDAILVKRGSTALDLANTVHSDLADSMIYAIDAVKKIRVGKDYVLKDGDVIRIVSAAKAR